MQLFTQKGIKLCPQIAKSGHINKIKKVNRRNRVSTAKYKGRFSSHKKKKANFLRQKVVHKNNMI